LEEVLRIAVLENIADMPLPAAPHPEEKPEAKAAKESLLMLVYAAAVLLVVHP